MPPLSRTRVGGGFECFGPAYQAPKKKKKAILESWLSAFPPNLYPRNIQGVENDVREMFPLGKPPEPAKKKTGENPRLRGTSPEPTGGQAQGKQSKVAPPRQILSAEAEGLLLYLHNRGKERRNAVCPTKEEFDEASFQLFATIMFKDIEDGDDAPEFGELPKGDSARSRRSSLFRRRSSFVGVMQASGTNFESLRCLPAIEPKGRARKSSMPELLYSNSKETLVTKEDDMDSFYDPLTFGKVPPKIDVAKEALKIKLPCSGLSETEALVNGLNTSWHDWSDGSNLPVQVRPLLGSSWEISQSKYGVLESLESNVHRLRRVAGAQR